MKRNHIPEVPKNVKQFVEQTSKQIGVRYSQLFKSQCEEHFCCFLDDSPIEQLLFTALNAIVHTWNMYLKYNVLIHPQKKIGKYRVDFLITFNNIQENNESEILDQIVVECDSQKFHERTEKERRYEKKRDRYLLQEGYKVFHYTGKEINKNPFSVAHDIIKNISGDAWGAYESIIFEIE